MRPGTFLLYFYYVYMHHPSAKGRLFTFVLLFVCFDILKYLERSPVPKTHCHPVPHQLSEPLHDACQWSWIPLGGWPSDSSVAWTATAFLCLGSRQQVPVPFSSPSWRSLLCSLSDGSRPTRTQVAGSELVRPPWQITPVNHIERRRLRSAGWQRGFPTALRAL